MLPIILIAAAILGMGLVLILSMMQETVAEGPGGATARGPLGGLVTEDKDKSKEKLRERLIHAGLYKQNSRSFFYMTQMSFAIVPLLLCMAGYQMGMISLLVAVIAGGLAGVMGVVAPGLALDFRKGKRQTNIRRSIPDALDVITICVEAGMSLNGAVVRVSKDLANTHPLLATELIIVHRQIQMGKTSGEALRSFAERFDLSELRSLASVVTQSEKFGASIAHALRIHGETLRKKRMQRAQEKAQKAAVWILLPTVFCIFPALFVVILGPAAYDIAEMMRNVGR